MACVVHRLQGVVILFVYVYENMGMGAFCFEDLE